MTQEERQIFLMDLCARLPHKVIIEGLEKPEILTVKNLTFAFIIQEPYPYRPYLRSMSSMTKDERIEFSKLLVKRYCEEDWEGHISTSYCIEIDNVYTDDEDGIKYPSPFSMDAIDWLNERHFDYRNLIERGLALEAPKEMYN